MAARTGLDADTAPTGNLLTKLEAAPSFRGIALGDSHLAVLAAPTTTTPSFPTSPVLTVYVVNLNDGQVRSRDVPASLETGALMTGPDLLATTPTHGWLGVGPDSGTYTPQYDRVVRLDVTSG